MSSEEAERDSDSDSVSSESEQERELEERINTEERGRVEGRTGLSSDCEVLLRSDLTDEEKLEIALNFSQYNPSSTFSFPTTLEYSKKRSFQYRYLAMYPWLGYSVNLNACLCLPCSLFNRQIINFARKPVSNWTTFNNKVKAHSLCSTHCWMFLLFILL